MSTVRREDIYTIPDNLAFGSDKLSQVSAQKTIHIDTKGSEEVKFIFEERSPGKSSALREEEEVEYTVSLERLVEVDNQAVCWFVPPSGADARKFPEVLFQDMQPLTRQDLARAAAIWQKLHSSNDSE